MKRILTLGLGVLAFALVPAFAQQPAPGAMGKIHGHVTNPTGEPQGVGSVSLSTDGGNTLKFTFPVNSSGDYTGEATPGTYMVLYRAPETPPGKMVDFIKSVKVEAGLDVLADIDMSRAEYISKLPADQQKQLADLKKANADAMKANVVINHLNADLRAVAEDKKGVDSARVAAAQALGATASRSDLEAKVEEIKNAKYTDIETLMTKDTQAKPDEAILWANLAYGQAGLKKYDDAIASYKKSLDLETASKKPRMEIIGVANSGLGEVYARTGKVPEATAAFDAAAKADPPRASLYLRNEAVIYSQVGNTAAQVAAANDAITVDPNDAILYYLKGQGLVQNATIDPKTQRIVLPQECMDAYKKYLELAPNGPYAPEVSGILSQAGEKVSSSYKAGRKK